MLRNANNLRNVEELNSNSIWVEVDIEVSTATIVFWAGTMHWVLFSRLGIHWYTYKSKSRGEDREIKNKEVVYNVWK